MSAEFNKSNLDNCLKELAKEFRKLAGNKMPAEIILVGGAAILANYAFRDMTYDMDAIINASSAINQAANIVGDKFGLPNFWLSEDFKKTRSYSNKLIQYSDYYKTFANVLEVRTIGGEYLICMKLMSGRPYKHDLSDVLGILKEHSVSGRPMTIEGIRAAFSRLYGSYDNMPEISKDFIEKVFADGNFEALYNNYKREESESREALVQFGKAYPNVLTEDNLEDILKKAKAKNS